MVRALITLLLLAVFFLSGMLFGMDHGKQVEQDTSEEKQEQQVETSANTSHEVETIEVVDDDRMDTDADSDQFTQTTAAFLGDIIHGFYEIVITVFYQFAQLFF